MMYDFIKCEKRNARQFINRVLPTIVFCVLVIAIFKILSTAQGEKDMSLSYLPHVDHLVKYAIL